MTTRSIASLQATQWRTCSSVCRTKRVTPARVVPFSPMETQSTQRPPRHVLVLGSTGSIGRQALEVLAVLPELVVVGLSANTDADLLLSQASALGVRDVCLADSSRATELAAREPSLSVRCGEIGLCDLIAAAADSAAAAGFTLTVLNGIVGAAGLARRSRRWRPVRLWRWPTRRAWSPAARSSPRPPRRSGALILPVDSEHSALFQCLAAARRVRGPARPSRSFC